MRTKWYPGAERRDTGVDGGTMGGGPPRGVIHRTETKNFVLDPVYYHIQYHPGTSRWVQLIPFDRASRALRRPFPRTPETQTNTMGSVNINLSIIGYSRDTQQDLDEHDKEQLRHFMRWCEDEWGIPFSAPKGFGGGECYGSSSPCRMLWDEWQLFTGWCGHQHVPYNTHWDPGKIDFLFEEEDMPQFTEEEAQELKLLVASLKQLSPPSNGGFAGEAVKLIRREREVRLHSHAGEPVPGVDPVARETATKAKDEVETLKGKLRSV